ncbi:MAG: gamma-glutamyl-gamma-aminobutyrate hydrolase family protein [Propionibacteriaceae bacterium]|jgi:putative glutamine amidotransferase|nr:gamma-glutamyl-gamma-aminobutyrate hydrolase family protein [Propionibacteriaceae bacterium]
MSRGQLAVVGVASRRPGRDAYQSLLDGLDGSVITRAAQHGWDPLYLYAADLGTAGLLAATENAAAVVLMGGEDVDPRLYDGPVDYPGGGHWEPAADAAEIELILRCSRRGVPLLGLCRGLQVLNVAYGGSLIQDLGPGLHGTPLDQPMPRHPVTIAANSILAPLAGPDGRATVAHDHHQAVDRLADRLQAIAWADDGVIEAVVAPGSPIVAVQWHPEDLAAPRADLDGVLDILATLAGSPPDGP